MTCKECYHYDACGGYLPSDLDKDVWDLCAKGKSDEIPDIEDRCSEFKDKSLIFELPAPFGTPTFIIGWKQRGCECYGYINTGVFKLNNLPYAGKTVFFSKYEATLALKALLEKEAPYWYSVQLAAAAAMDNEHNKSNKKQIELSKQDFIRCCEEAEKALKAKEGE